MSVFVFPLVTITQPFLWLSLAALMKGPWRFWLYRYNCCRVLNPTDAYVLKFILVIKLRVLLSSTLLTSTRLSLEAWTSRGMR